MLCQNISNTSLVEMQTCCPCAFCITDFLSWVFHTPCFAQFYKREGRAVSSCASFLFHSRPQLPGISIPAAAISSFQTQNNELYFIKRLVGRPSKNKLYISIKLKNKRLVCLYVIERLIANQPCLFIQVSACQHFVGLI